MSYHHRGHLQLTSRAEKGELARQLASFFWFAVHNFVAHPLLMTYARWADDFHRWSGDRSYEADVQIMNPWPLLPVLGGAVLTALAVVWVAGAVTVVGWIAGGGR